MHGANRLASNSLLEALVFSRRAANDIIAKLKTENNAPFDKEPHQDNLSGNEMPKGFRTEIRRIMQDCHFVIPKPEAVADGLKRINEIRDNILNGGYTVNQDFVEARSLATVASIVLKEVSEENDTE